MRIFSENSSILAEKVKRALEVHDTDTALLLMEDPNNYAALKTGSSQFLPVLSKYICSKYESEDTDLFNYCVKMLEKLVDVALVEDILAHLLELMETSDSTNFSVILLNVVRVIKRAPKEKTQYLGWCVNSIQLRLNKCNIPEYGVTSVSSDDDVFYIEILYQDVLRFYDSIMPIYSELFPEYGEYRLILIKYLIELLAKPMGYVDLGPHNEKSKLRKMAENIVGKVLSICTDPFIYLGVDENDLVCPNSFAYGMFLHFLLDENVKYRVTPNIYSNIYLFRLSLFNIVKLLKSFSNQVILKGLFTLEMLLKRTPKLSYVMLDTPANKELCEAMETITVYNQCKETRQRCLDIFKLYLYNFEPKGQYLFLTNLIFRVHHTGLAGYFITQYKEILFELQNKQSPQLYLFEGKNLYDFIDKCCRNVDTNGTFQYDKIMSLLNLMRFTVIQLKFEHRQQFSEVATDWRDNFFKRLETSLEKLKLIVHEKIHNVENDKLEINCKFEINFENADRINSLTKSEKIMSLGEKLNDIDMCYDLMKRVIELLEEKHC